MPQCTNPQSNNNFSVLQGRTFSKAMTLSASGTPVDLTGSTVSGQVGLRGVDVALTCTLTDAMNGKFSVSLSATQTAALLPGVYRYEIIVTYTDGSIKPLLYGNFVVVAVGT